MRLMNIMKNKKITICYVFSPFLLIIHQSDTIQTNLLNGNFHLEKV